MQIFRKLYIPESLDKDVDALEVASTYHLGAIGVIWSFIKPFMHLAHVLLLDPFRAPMQNE